MTWIYFLGSVGIKDNEKEDKLTGKVAVQGTLRTDKENIVKTALACKQE